MTYTFVKAMGGEVGDSLVEEDKLDLALEIIETAKSKGVRLCIPTDSMNADKFDNDANEYSLVGNVPEGFMGLDIGHQTAQQFTEIIEQSATLLWNGQWVFLWKLSQGTKTLPMH